MAQKLPRQNGLIILRAKKAGENVPAGILVITRSIWPPSCNTTYIKKGSLFPRSFPVFHQQKWKKKGTSPQLRADGIERSLRHDNLWESIGAKQGANWTRKNGIGVWGRKLDQSVPQALANGAARMNMQKWKRPEATAAEGMWAVNVTEVVIIDGCCGP